MIYIFITSLLIPIIILINTFVKKRGLLLSYLGEKHQKFTTNNEIPLTGGIFIFLFSIKFCFFILSSVVFDFGSIVRY